MDNREENITHSCAECRKEQRERKQKEEDVAAYADLFGLITIVTENTMFPPADYTYLIFGGRLLNCVILLVGYWIVFTISKVVYTLACAAIFEKFKMNTVVKMIVRVLLLTVWISASILLGYVIRR